MKDAMRRQAASLAACLLVLAAPSRAVEESYPATVKTIEEMRLTKPINLRLSKSTTHKSKEMRTVVILAYVGKDGSVVKSKIQQPSGAHHLDETVLLAMRDVRFKPHVVDGEPAEVSVVIPMHVPADDIDRTRF